MERAWVSSAIIIDTKDHLEMLFEWDGENPCGDQFLSIETDNKCQKCVGVKRKN